MRRRPYLGWVVAGAGALAGCGGVFEAETTPSVEDLPPMTVTHRHFRGFLGRDRRVIAQRSRVEFTLEYRQDDRTPCHLEESLSDREFGELKRLVHRSRPEEWNDRYDCSLTCSSDDGLEELIAVVDGTEYRTTIDPAAVAPDRIEAVRERMRRLEDRFDPDEACES